MHILLEYNHALFDELLHIEAENLCGQALTDYFRCGSIQIELAWSEIYYGRPWMLRSGLDRPWVPILNI